MILVMSPKTWMWMHYLTPQNVTQNLRQINSVLRGTNRSSRCRSYETLIAIQVMLRKYAMPRNKRVQNQVIKG